MSTASKASLIISSVSRASSSSSLEMANPAWTMTKSPSLTSSSRIIRLASRLTPSISTTMSVPSMLATCIGTPRHISSLLRGGKATFPPCRRKSSGALVRRSAATPPRSPSTALAGRKIDFPLFVYCYNQPYRSVIFSQGQGDQGMTRRRGSATSHKESRRSTQRLRKRRTPVVAGYGCLSQGQPSVIWRHQPVGENLESIAGQGAVKFFCQQLVLEDAPGKNHPPGAAFLADLLAHVRRCSRHCIVKTPGYNLPGVSGLDILKNRLDAKAKIDL